MPKTKIQKEQVVETAAIDLKKSETVILTDFTGLTANEMNSLRKTVRSMGGVFHVVKKRLLKIILGKESMVFDPDEFKGQTGVVFSPKDMVETSSVVYQFARQQRKDVFKILGGFDVKAMQFTKSADVIRFGQLPPREVLLGQLVGMLTIPIRKLLFVLKQKSQMVEQK
ncbi:50S ribosomal protein L10 [Candidatus Jorgensenbacteria bacterium]|nr:50S ribosomal protein L10 [Candidatus Jorgensenbacteria bacterium]